MTYQTKQTFSSKDSKKHWNHNAIQNIYGKIKILYLAFALCKCFIYLKHRVNWSGRHWTPAGRRVKRETPQAERRGGSRRSPRKADACSGNERAT